MSEQLTLYTARVCPYAQRAEIALAEVGAKYTRFEIDLQNKPVWYAPQVNPASKVPAVAYGGPEVPPDQPSRDSVKIAESLVLLEFVADLHPGSPLLPKDPVQRAQVRFFIDAVSNKVPANWFAFMARGESPDALISGLETIQSLLPEGKKFAVGDEFTIADAAIAPFLTRIATTLGNDIGVYEEGQGKKVYETIWKSPKFAKLQKYYENLTERSSVRETYNEQLIKDTLGARFTPKRNA
ncbi:glutathione S-transferase [Schizopora paradoxa]|uniref:Glutathione S-transferase n=1 Tax=Schizopora paradoxa TaxID=27342 RepID=A0A0H2RET3_9AGAM|nr:glutathione S-transferase [Schizopora paradoxa]